MALNKFMHPRNIYKNPPDFCELAKTYQEFSSIAKFEVTGKVSIDFKDPHALRILTKCLLKCDFNLDVVIPEDRLVPTLPLRLNYILWIEDLLNPIQKTDNIRGLDIGTGACAIYPLLAAVKNKWYMVGTETDEQSLLQAQENIQRNKLQELIQLRKNPADTIFEHLFANNNELSFDFSMCNPPFYSNVEELCESRSPARLPPKNGFTGSPQELITVGGELAFCRKMIKESKDNENKVLIYTTMVGHKYNLKELIIDLKAQGIKHTSTEFCQGRVTRWGLAWTYQEYEISKFAPVRDNPRKKSVPITFLLPDLPNTLYNLETVSKKIKLILQELKITYKLLHKRGNNLSLEIKAFTNTWSNQRRKRRLLKKECEKNSKRLKVNDSSDTIDGVNLLENAKTVQKISENSEDSSIRTQKVAVDEVKRSKDINEKSSAQVYYTNSSEIKTEKNSSNKEDLVNSIVAMKKLEADQANPVHNKMKKLVADEAKAAINKMKRLEVDEADTALNNMRKLEADEPNAALNRIKKPEADEPNAALNRIKKLEADQADITHNKIKQIKTLETSTNSYLDTCTAQEGDAEFCNSTLNSTCSKLNTSIESEPVVHAFLKVLKKENSIFLEMEDIDGSARKEGLHQIVQYIKNNWK